MRETTHKKEHETPHAWEQGKERAHICEQKRESAHTHTHTQE